MRSEPMILVRDVQASACWYRQLLACESDHGLEEFDRIVADGTVVLMLHRGDATEHGAIRKQDVVGNGFLLWIYVADLDAVYSRAKASNAEIIVEPHVNQQAQWREFTLRDPDGYSVAIVEP